MEWTWMRRAALAVCVCAGLLLAPGCGGETDTGVDANAVDEEDAERAMEKTEKVQKDLLDAQNSQDDNAGE